MFLLVASMILQGIGPVSVAYASTTQSGEGILETAEDQNTAEQKEEGGTEKEPGEVTTVEGTSESESESLMSGAMIDGEMPLVQDKEGQTQEETIETEDLEEPGSYASTWGEWKLGNSGAAILGGGRLAEAPDGMFFFSEENSGTIDYWDAGGIEREAVGEEGTSLNAFSGAVYYVADENLVRRWDRETGAVETILEWD